MTNHRSLAVKTGFLILATGFLLAGFMGRGFHIERVSASSAGPTPSMTGAPDEANCTACHTDFPVNSGTGDIVIEGLPATFTPGQQIPITVTVNQSDAVIFGFQLTAIDELGANAGVITLPAQNPAEMRIRQGVVNTDTRFYVSHTSNGTQPSQFGTRSWTFLWTAPNDGRTNITLYAAGNAANSDNDPSGDYIYTTSASTVLSSGSTLFDFDGDGKTDASVFRPTPSSAIESRGPEGSTSQWWIYKSSDGGNLAYGFGTPDDKQVAADFTGDGKTDIAFWRPATGEWYILRSEDLTFFAFPFGANGDIPAPGDFDGDGKADPAVFRPSIGTWFIFRSSDSQVASVPFGFAGDKPTVADFDGDGTDDIAVFRPSASQWWQLRSTQGVKAYGFGATGDRTAVGDWTGDGKADVAYYRPSTSEFYVIRSEDESFYAFPWGSAGDIPVPGDYDGDGTADAAVWRPSNTTWFILGTTSGFQAIPFGATGDVPVPSSVSVQ